MLELLAGLTIRNLTRLLMPVRPETAAAFRKRLYTAQQRVAITGPEASVLLGFVVVVLIGLGVRYFQEQGVDLPPTAYAHLDAAVQDRAARSAEEARTALADSLRHAREGAPLAEANPLMEAEAPAGPAAPAAARPGRLGPVRVNVNTASPAMLERLPGIGPALAARIVEHRELNGPFRRPEDVVQVRGIGPRTYERLAPYLFVGE